MIKCSIKYKFGLYVLVLLIVLIKYTSYPSNYDDLSSYEGLHFSVSFMENEYKILNEGIDLKIFIAAKEFAKIKITYPGKAPKLYELSPDTLHVENVDPIWESRGKSEITRNNAIRIDSDVPITIYCHSSQYESSDSYASIPISNWGSNYIIISQPNEITEVTHTSGAKETIYRESEFLIISAYDSTKVTITPSNPTLGGKAEGVPFDVILNQNETYLVKSSHDIKYNGDLTGTNLSSSKPIGVLSGHVRTPMPPGHITRDHLIEMLSPIEAWGKEFISVPFGISEGGDIIRIVAKEIPTQVEIINGAETQLLTIDNSKKFIELKGITEPIHWKADKPVQMAQFMAHLKENEINFKMYDPCMVLVPPREQYVRQIMFQTPGNIFKWTNQYDHHYVALAVESEAIATLSLDGKKLDSANRAVFKKIGSTGLYWTKIELKPGRHILKCYEGGYSGVLYATGNYDSYAYILGASLRLPGLNDTIPPIIDFTENCGKFQFEIYDADMNGSGLLYANVEDYATYNFTWDEKEFKLEDKKAIITANIKNPYINGKIVLKAQDRSGNLKSFTYLYYKTEVDVPTSYDFKQVNWNDSVPKSKSIINYSNKTMSINSIKLINDNRIKFYTSKSLPAVLNKGEMFEIIIAFKPDFNSQPLNAKLIVERSCNEIDTIPITANVVAPSLFVKDVDFGNVLITKKADDSLFVENQGNVDLTITKVNYSGDNLMFDFNLVKPLNLPPGKSGTIPVFFTPAQRAKYNIKGELENSAGIANTFYCTGVGVSPLFNSITVDFGKRRVGTDNDTIIHFKNVGDHKGNFTFLSFFNQSHDFNSTNYLQKVSLPEINIGEDAILELPINLPKAEIYNIVAQFSTSVPTINPIYFTLLGEGTLPVLNKTDVVFDDIEVFQIDSKNVSIISSAGNEKLLIRKARIIENDPAFVFDINDLNNKSMKIGEKYNLDVKFLPTTSGMHIAKIEVETDAMPNFQSKFDTITIYGKALIPNIENIKIEVNHDDIYVCNNSLLKIEITNLGTTSYQLDGYELLFEPNDMEFTVVDGDFKNKILNINEKHIIDLQIIPTEHKNYKLIFKLKLFGKDSIMITHVINPIKQKSEIIDIKDVRYDIGSNYNFKFEGKYPYPIDIKLPFELNINMEDIHFMIDTTNIIELKLGEEFYKLNILRGLDFIRFISIKDLDLTKQLTWSFSFNALALLDSLTHFDLEAEMPLNNCYYNGLDSFSVDFNKVCYHSESQIRYIEGMPGIEIYPNPVMDNIKIDLFLPNESTINIEIIDIFGKKNAIVEKKSLQLGKHLLNFSFCNIPNGVYFLVIDVNGNEYNKLIVINK